MDETDKSFDLRGIIGSSLLEWDGRIAAVAIAGGCNWRCPFCHSWRYVTGLDALPRLDMKELWARLDKKDSWLDGVVVTGGEPTLQPGLADLLRGIRARRLEVKLHTNGSHPEVLKMLLDQKLIDCLALDCKAPLDGGLPPAAGLANAGPQAREESAAAVQQSLDLARRAQNIIREYHTTLCPKFVDEASLAEIGRMLPPGGVWILQNYEPGDVLDNAAAGTRRYLYEELDRLEQAAKMAYPDGKVMLRRGRGQ